MSFLHKVGFGFGCLDANIRIFSKGTAAISGHTNNGYTKGFGHFCGMVNVFCVTRGAKTNKNITFFAKPENLLGKYIVGVNIVTVSSKKRGRFTKVYSRKTALKLGKKNPILPLPCYSCWDWICELPVPKEHNLNAGGQLT